MPIVIFYRNGQHEVFQSRDTRGLLDFRRIQLTTFDGDETYVFPDDVRRVQYVPDEKWSKGVEEAEKKREEQEKKQAEEAAKRKEEETKKKADEDAAYRKPWNRIRRLFGKSRSGL